jgi:pimeloyl-ACP methyl ester carboxylesterase
MKILNTLVFLSLVYVGPVSGQTITANNLTHSPGYVPAPFGSIPVYKKIGSGQKVLILIPGLGFSQGVFEDFAKENASNYTMYVITIPGFGGSRAPAMPVNDTSYGLQNWNRSVIQGIIKLIDKEKLAKPFIIGHFVQGTQLALKFAIDYPDKVSGVIVLGGPARFIAIIQGQPAYYPLASSIKYIDKVMAPKWFRGINKKDYDKGNYSPEIYSLDSIKGKELWNEVAAVELPVSIRYLCEFFASDISLEFNKIKCPVLVLRAAFSSDVRQNPTNNYLNPQFITAWDSAQIINPLIQVKDIPDAATFVWKDNPRIVYDYIKEFVK